MVQEEEEVKEFKADLNRITAAAIHKQGQKSRKGGNHTKKLKKKYTNHTKYKSGSTEPLEIQDTITQRIAKITKLRAYIYKKPSQTNGR